MSEKERFLPYDEAARLVAAIQEEEDVRCPDHRILTVYSQEDKELCWFDYDEVMRDAGISKKDADAQMKVTEYILHRIPDWVLEL